MGVRMSNVRRSRSAGAPIGPPELMCSTDHCIQFTRNCSFSRGLGPFQQEMSTLTEKIANLNHQAYSYAKHNCGHSSETLTKALSGK